ncbi:hypothetical protein Tco_0471052 [Tanacetum coccineum]
MLKYMGRPTAETRNTSQTPTNDVREAMQMKINNGHVSWINNVIYNRMNGQQHGCKRRQEDDNTGSTIVRNQVILKAGDTIDENFDGGGGGSFGDEAVVVDFVN